MNLEHKKQYNKDYRIKNKDILSKKKKEYDIKNKDKKKEYLKEWRLKNKDKLKEYNIKNKDKMKEYNIINKDRLSEQRKGYRLRNKDRIFYRDIKYKYNLTPDQYNKMLADQNGCCKICDTKMISPHVDHCHKTDKIRGLLCMNCNTSLGKLKEDTRILNKMIEYIKEHNNE